MLECDIRQCFTDFFALVVTSKAANNAQQHHVNIYRRKGVLQQQVQGLAALALRMQPWGGASLIKHDTARNI